MTDSLKQRINQSKKVLKELDELYTRNAEQIDINNQILTTNGQR